MESIGDLLASRQPKAPDEITAIKDYIAKNFSEPCSVAVRGESLIITVESASLAGILRLRSLQMQKECQTTKKLVFRIG